jgi:hypothetical protein
MDAFSWDMTRNFELVLSEPEVTDARLLLASQDYVRNVVAHEVGHVLGLRHNFAGSLESTLSPAELDKWFEEYLTGEQPPDTKGKLTTSSVMEYSIFQAAVFNGCKIRTTDEVLPHDKAAIQWGYFDSDEGRANGSLFRGAVRFELLSGAITAVQSVTVRLTNSVGVSEPVTGAR